MRFIPSSKDWGSGVASGADGFGATVGIGVAATLGAGVSGGVGTGDSDGFSIDSGEGEGAGFITCGR
jgi:hypothetical protein